MQKAATLLVLALLLITLVPSQALAQDDCTEDDCGDCTDCRNNNFYYILVAAIIVFLVFFYLRNRAPVMKTPEKPDEPVQREE